MRRPVPPLTLAEAGARAGVDVASDLAEVRVVRAPGWLERLWGGAVDGMALPGRVFLRADAYARVVAGEAPRLLRHEAAHLRQWRRDGAVRFLARYLGDYLSARMVGMPHDAAYRAIRFEREAIAAEAGARGR